MDPLTTIIRSLIDLVWSSVPLTIIFTCATIVGLFFFNFFQKKYGWKWTGAALTTMVVCFTLFFALIHFSNLYAGLSTSDSSLIPPEVRDNPEYQADQPNFFVMIFSILIQSFLSGIIFSILVLPFAFGGVALFDGLKTRMKGVWPRILLICFLSSVLFILLLGVFPWILVSLVYLVFFGI